MGGLVNIQRVTRSVIVSLVVTAIWLCAMVGLMFGLSSDQSSDLSYRTLNYDVKVLDNGDLKIVEHIDMKLKDRSDDDGDRPWKQLYQQYTLKQENLTAISDVSVKNVTTGKTYTQIDPKSPNSVSQSAWNDDYAGHWYIGDVSESDYNPPAYQEGSIPDFTDQYDERTVEIGWNIPATTEADSLKFDIAMTFKGVSTAYTDVTSFQWEPFGPANQTPIGTVSATVTFPKGVTKKNSWGWLHFDGRSQTTRTKSGALSFTAYDVRDGEHLDLVAMFDGAYSSGVTRTRDTANKVAIMDDETTQERLAREEEHEEAVRTMRSAVLFAIIGVLLILWGVVASIISNKAAKYTGDIEYWREPPDMSPASAAKLLSIVEPISSSTLKSRQMAATVLSLASKKAIAIYPGAASHYRGIDMSTASATDIAAKFSNENIDEGRHLRGTNTIVIMPVCTTNRASLNLSESEDRALRLLEAAQQRLHSPVFDLQQMKSSFSSWETGYKFQDAYNTSVDVEFNQLKAATSAGTQAKVAGILGIVLAAITALYMIVHNQVALGFVISGLMVFGSVFALHSKVSEGLTEHGQPLAGRVLGLKRYLEHFSDFTDRGVPDLVLWDRYLVYAASFGISKEVIAQLAAAYPQVSDPQWLDAHATSPLLYWSYRPYGWYMPSRGSGQAGMPQGFDPGSFSANAGNLGAQLTSSFADLSHTIQAAAPSSTSSSGGSFSSGGGGFSGSSGGSGGGSFGGR